MSLYSTDSSAVDRLRVDSQVSPNAVVNVTYPHTRPGPSSPSGPNRLVELLRETDLSHLPPCEPVHLADADRGAADYHAISSALGCPDLFLIAGGGPGLLADLTRSAAADDTVLVLTNSVQLADALVASLADHATSEIGRAVGPDEVLERLPAASFTRTDAGMEKRAAQQVAARVAALEERLRHRDELLTLLGTIGEEPNALTHLQDEESRLLTERSGVADFVRSESAAQGPDSGSVFGFITSLFGKSKTAGAAVADDDVAVKIACREREIDARLAAVRETAGKRRINQDRLCQLIATIDGHCLMSYESDELDQTRQHVLASREQIEREITAGRKTTGGTPRPNCRIVVGPITSDSDPLVKAVGRFGRVVCAEAETLDEPQFLAAATLADRWILVGDPAGASQRGRPAGGGFRPPFFGRLWQQWYRRTWVREGRRLVARLAEVSYRDTVRTEPLNDRPEIELRFAEDAAGTVTLAAVLFPLTVSAGHAKSFLAGELDEIRLSPCGPIVWHESSETITASWPAVTDAVHDPVTANLTSGIAERVLDTGTDLLTAAIQFDLAAGWDRSSAEEWVAHHTLTARTCRTALAARPDLRNSDHVPAG